MIPGLDSTKEEVRSTEETFLERGLATFSVDGPGQGEAEYDVKIRGDWGPVAEVLYAAIGDQPDLDRSRLAVWGVSLGGYYSVRVTAALGDRVTAAVALAGPFNFGECWDGLPPLTRDTFRVRSGTRDDDEARAVASTLDLTEVAGSVTAPMLLVFGKRDRLIPYQQAEKVHAAVPRSELLMLEEANHGCADYSPWHRPRTADWLASRLGGDVGDPAVAHAKAGV
jgi:2,6-dihydroxypseudooxynicotine hydrolase